MACSANNDKSDLVEHLCIFVKRMWIDPIRKIGIRLQITFQMKLRNQDSTVALPYFSVLLGTGPALTCNRYLVYIMINHSAYQMTDTALNQHNDCA